MHTESYPDHTESRQDDLINTTHLNCSCYMFACYPNRWSWGGKTAWHVEVYQPCCPGHCQLHHVWSCTLAAPWPPMRWQPCRTQSHPHVNPGPNPYPCRATPCPEDRATLILTLPGSGCGVQQQRPLVGRRPVRHQWRRHAWQLPI